VHHRIEFQFQPGVAAAGDGNGQAHADHRSHGPRNRGGQDGKAEAVSYIDKATRTEKRVYAKAIVVAASACESARLLLNSKSALFPDGLGNSQEMLASI